MCPELLAAADEPSRADAEVRLAEGILAFRRAKNGQAEEAFREAAGFDPAFAEPQYWWGLALLRLEDAKAAAEKIAVSLELGGPSGYDRARVLSDLGAARLAAGNAVAAEVPLREAIDRAPRDAVALHRYGLALQALGRSGANEALAEAKRRDPGVAERAAAVVEPEWQPPRFAVDPRPAWANVASFEIASDSNPNLLSDDFRLPSFDGDRLVEGSEPDSLAQLSVHTSYQPVDLVGGWRWGVAADARRSFHQEFGELDLELLQGVVHLARGKDPRGLVAGPLGTARVPFGRSRASFLVQAGLSHARLDGRSYLRRFAGSASLVLWESAATATHVDLELADLHFFIEPPLLDRRSDGRDLSVRLSQSFVLGRRDRSLRIGVLAGERGGGRAASGSRLEAWADAALPIAAGWLLHLGVAAGREEYDHSESNLFIPSGPPREDDLLRASAAVVWEVGGGWRWMVRGLYVQRDSSVDLGPDLPDLGYERTRIAAGVSWSF